MCLNGMDFFLKSDEETKPQALAPSSSEMVDVSNELSSNPILNGMEFYLMYI